MSPPVTAALISGSVALVVALVGIAGAIAAQSFATRRAFDDSLALFERQRSAQEQEQREQSRREDAYRFADQRRTIYARMLRAAADLHETGGSIYRSRRITQIILRPFIGMPFPCFVPRSSCVGSAADRRDRAR
jgi:hypothetical protein